MVLQDMTPAEAIQAAYARGLSANKAARLIKTCSERQYEQPEEARGTVCDALLERLIAPHPPSLLFSYVPALIAPDIELGSIFVQTLLLKLHASLGEVPMEMLVPIANALLESTWATSTLLLPGTLTPPSPSIGTSTSAIQDTVFTLSLTVPLLRMIASDTSLPLPIVDLTARIISAIPAYPAPPLEVGIEVSVLMPTLPEVVASPLRNALSGMMADLNNGNNAVLSDGPLGTVDAFGNPPLLPRVPPISTSNPALLTDADTNTPIPTLPSPFAGPAPIPMQHAISFLLAYAQRESRCARVVEQGLWSSHVDIIRVGRAFRVDSASFVLNLVEGAIVAVLDRYQQLDRQFEEALVFWMEHLPDMLRWWKEHGTEEWAYPSNVAECIKTAMETCRSGLQNAWTHLQKEYQRRVSVAETEDDNASHPSVEEAGIASYAETFLRKLVQVGVLGTSEATEIWPEAQIVPLEMFAPASMLDDLLEGNKASLPVKELTILTGPGAQRLFATIVLGSIRSHPQTPLPENLLPILSSSPALLAALTTIIPPRALLDVLVDRLLSAPIDEGARADDPQGVLTRWGEGVVLVEAVVHAFGLDLPEMLKQSRRSRGMSHLSRESRVCLGGWVKALSPMNLADVLFGSEGIDDQIILAPGTVGRTVGREHWRMARKEWSPRNTGSPIQTAPQDLCWLSTVIIQQAIFAMASGQLDLDALHSGLSYFAQPLLSWCLGGIVSWLSAEIIRNGSIAPLHMEVLQSLILDDGFPEPLLRVNAAAIMCFMEPTKGLGEVMDKAGFDGNAVKAKLQSIGANTLPNELPINSHHPLNVFRSNLQVMRHLEVTPPTWSPSFLADCTNAVARSSPGSATSIMLSDIIRPSMEYDQTNGDPLAVFIYILLSLPLDGREPHIKVALDAALPIILGRNMTESDTVCLASTVKGMLVLFAELREGEVKGVWEGLMDKLSLLVGKAGTAGNAGEQGEGEGRKRKRERKGQVRDTMDELIATNARTVRRMLAADEEMSGRWGRL